MKTHVDLLNEIYDAGMNRMSEKVFENLKRLTKSIENNLDTNEYNLSDAEEQACLNIIKMIRIHREKLSEAMRP